jgi:hypothetical protein
MSRRSIQLLFAAVLTLEGLLAQTWTSGFDATKSDGAFNLTSSDPRIQNGVFYWDPVRDNYDQDGDNIYHFTSFTVGADVYIRMTADRMRNPGPIVIIVQGAVRMNGRIDLSGNSGHDATQDFVNRAPSIPGPGGFPGGAGGKPGEATGQRGFGPGSPGASAGQGCPAGHTVLGILRDTRLGLPNRCGPAGPTYGSSSALPLIGGSGGSGGGAQNDWSGTGGGAGGGAIRLISGDSIEMIYTGGCCIPYIIAQGGNSGANKGQYYGGPGSGGMVHLQAPRVTVPNDNRGGLQARGARNRDGYDDYSSNGRIRIDTDLWNGGYTEPLALVGPLVQIPLPTQPVLRVISVDGQNVTQNPKGFYTTPDLAIDKTSPVPIVVRGTNIPTGTTVNIFLNFDPGTADTSSSVTLTGTVADSTGTLNVSFPRGVSRFFVRAVW